MRGSCHRHRGGVLTPNGFCPPGQKWESSGVRRDFLRGAVGRTTLEPGSVPRTGVGVKASGSRGWVWHAGVLSRDGRDPHPREVPTPRGSNPERFLPREGGSGPSYNQIGERDRVPQVRARLEPVWRVGRDAKESAPAAVQVQERRRELPLPLRRATALPWGLRGVREPDHRERLAELHDVLLTLLPAQSRLLARTGVEGQAGREGPESVYTTLPRAPYAATLVCESGRRTSAMSARNTVHALA